MTATAPARQSRVADTSLSRFTGPVIRSWPVVALLVVCGFLVGGVIPSLRPIGYTATADVLLRPVVADPATNQRVDQLVSLDTEAVVIGSDAVLGRASELTGHTLADLRRNLRVVAVPSSQVLRVSQTRTRPNEASRAADAVTDAYLEQRQERARELVVNEITSITGQIVEAETILNDLSARLVATPPGSVERTSLQPLLTSKTQQLTSLQTRLDTLKRTQIDSGEILRGPKKTTTSGFDRSTTVPAGGLIGLLAGMALAVLLDRLSRKVRRAGDVLRATGHRILATVSDERLDQRLAAADAEEPGAVNYRQALLAIEPERHAIVAVIGSRDGDEAAQVSSGLATVAARGGSNVALLRLQFGGAAAAGLLDVTALDAGGRALASAEPAGEVGRGLLTVYFGDQSLEVLATPLGLAHAAARLRAAHDLVVIEINDLVGSASAEGWIRTADRTVVAVRLGRTRSGHLRSVVARLEDASRLPRGSIVLG